MGKRYGLVLTVVIPVFVVFLSWIIFRKRKHPFVKSRKPDFILVQNVGVIISFILTSLYIALRPDFPCSLNVFSNIINLSIVGYVLYVRVWEYCLCFHMSLLKARMRSNEFALDWKENSWLYKHAYVAQHSFFQKILYIGIIVLTVPGFYFFFPLTTMQYDPKAQMCILHTAYTTGYTVPAVILIASGLFVAFLIRNSSDAYRLRREKFSLIFVWLLIFFFVYIYSITGSEEMFKSVPPVFFQLVGQFITVCITNFCPLYYAFIIDRSEPTKESQERFITLLECPHFRNGFYNYLTEQFCGENLQFYESVQTWKTLRSDDPKKRANAQLIYESFVVDGGICQVHMQSETREKIIESLKKLEISDHVFDSAITALLQDMYYNSFLLFCRTQEYIEYTTV